MELLLCYDLNIFLYSNPFAGIIPTFCLINLNVAGHTYGAGAYTQAAHSSEQTAYTNVPPTQATSPLTEDLLVSVQAITQHRLDFNAHIVLGIGHNSEIIVVKLDSTCLHRIAHDGKDYIQKFKKKLPWTDGNCYKGIDGDRIFLQKYWNADTICYNKELQEVCTFQQKGFLFDCIGDELFYCQGAPGKLDGKIVVCQIDEQTLLLKKNVILQPPVHRCWGITPSICRVMESYVVVESEARALDIFDANGMICIIQLINQSSCMNVL